MREHLKRLRALACLALAAAMPCAPVGAASAVRCVPVAGGVPALAGPPNFLNPAVGEPNYWPRVDDPRWRGALSRSWGQGVSPHATFRALRVGGAQPALYLSWVVTVAPQPQQQVDRIRVAFGTSGGATQALEIVPFSSTGTDIKAGNPVMTRLWTLNGTWTAGVAPTWATADARVWLASAPWMWAVNLRVPMTNPFGDGQDLAGQFPFAFQLHVNHSDATLADYRFDDSVALLQGASSAAPTNTSPATWSTLNVTLPLTDATCASDVGLSSADVGTTNAVPHRINLSSPNTFSIKPANRRTVGKVGAHTVAASIRIANWGTAPDRNDVVGPLDNLWSPITTAADTPDNDADIPLNDKGSILYPWSLPTMWRCEFVGTDGVPAAENGGVAIAGDPSCPGPRTRRLHQCILVELRGGGLVYAPGSVVRNMDFVDASTFEREAEVSVVGLKPLNPGAPRDVYLYLQTLQMPADVTAPRRPSPMFDLAKVEAVLAQHGDDRRLRGVAAGAAPTRPKRVPGGVEFETLNQIYPTYLVHAFNDSGDTLSFDGQLKHVLRPQTSFGYYVNHDGPLTGWEAELKGAVPVPGTADYYVIAVPENDVRSVTTRIVAREGGPARFAVWFALGQAIPHASFATLHRRGPAAALGVDYALGPTSAIEGSLALHRFRSRTGGPDVDVTQFAVSGVWTRPLAGWKPFALAGAGAYGFDPGRTRFGVQIGAGVRVEVARAWQIEGRIVRHRVAGNAPDTSFSAVQIGVRREF